MTHVRATVRSLARPAGRRKSARATSQCGTIAVPASLPATRGIFASATHRALDTLNGYGNLYHRVPTGECYGRAGASECTHPATMYNDAVHRPKKEADIMLRTRLTIIVLALLIAFVLALIGGIAGGASARTGQVFIREGTVWSVEWQDGRNGTRGLTRARVPEAVPGDTGSWNVDMAGRLFTTHLELERRAQKDLGVQVIPMSRIVSIQFGDGGILETEQNPTD